jgi:hypothetical protein
MKAPAADRSLTFLTILDDVTNFLAAITNVVGVVIRRGRWGR